MKEKNSAIMALQALCFSTLGVLGYGQVLESAVHVYAVVFLTSAFTFGLAEHFACRAKQLQLSQEQLTKAVDYCIFISHIGYFFAFMLSVKKLLMGDTLAATIALQSGLAAGYLLQAFWEGMLESKNHNSPQ